MHLIGLSKAIHEIRRQLARVAAADSTVLITGETGTGKEVVAASIHEQSRRSLRPFVAVNCAAIPETLIEGELFGYERGAYTGATAGHPGRLTLADGGTLFLDEIGEMSALAQAKLLRAIETRSVWRVGGSRSVDFDARIIAATNRDVEADSVAEHLRADLFYRLNVVRLHLPPLRERLEDLPPLLDCFVAEFNRRFDRQVLGFGPDVLKLCLNHVWPGNVRELRSFVEATFVHAAGSLFAVGDLAPAWRTRLQAIRGPGPGERERLLSALLAARGNKAEAARELRCSRMTLYRKLQRYRLADASRASD